jgi:hypothetical protein
MWGGEKKKRRRGRETDPDSERKAEGDYLPNFTIAQI